MIKRFIAISFAAIVLASSALYIHFRLNVHPVIENKLYRSAQLSDKNLNKNIHKLKLKSIINLRGRDEEEEWYQQESRMAKKNNIPLYNVRLSASKLPVSTEMDKLVHLLQTAKKPILLHCQAGADRSGMASALALSILEDASLPKMREQLSLRYFINPFNTNSVGKLFFSAYESYLKKNRLRHQRENLLSWIDNTYIDYKGNIEFAIEFIGPDRFHSNRKDRRSVTIHRDGGPKVLSGWAFNRREKKAIKYLGISMDGTTYHTRFVSERPDVAAYYHLDNKDFENFKFGFIADIDIERLNKGCHKISLQVGESDSSFRLIEDTRYDLCVK